MSFKKVGINYINDKLFKCMLQSGGKYFVELRNGVRIPVSQEDYGTLIEDLVVVNGVAYADLSLIASCKAVDGGYIVEFANGNQFTITQANYEALVAAGFCAIGDTYYNPAQIDKLYEANGEYFAQFKNCQTKTITEEEYNAATGAEPGPTPGGLTPFEVNQTITGYDFGDVSNGDTSAAMDAFLAGLDYSDGGVALCSISADKDENPLLTAFDASTEGGSGYGILNSGDIGNEGIVYLTEATLGMSAGFNGLTDGKIIGSTPKQISAVNAAQGWNGVLIGAVEGEPAGGLTPFTLDPPQTLSGIEVDPTVTTVDVGGTTMSLDDWIDSFNDEAVCMALSDSMGKEDYARVEINPEGGAPGVIVITAADGYGVMYSTTLSLPWEGGITINPKTWYYYDSESDPTEFTAKRQFLFGSSVEISASTSHIETDFSPINGVLVGAVLAQ